MQHFVAPKYMEMLTKYTIVMQVRNMKTKLYIIF